MSNNASRSKKNTQTIIDFVITWVDNLDPEWVRSKNKYKNETMEDGRDVRFRDLGLLKYWFRAVEKYAPWVNRIHFVTSNQIPEWINIDNPKLNIVDHRDYMPKEILPTFNSVPIELYLHKIPNLSEHFVYFNDDMFLNRNAKPSLFFKKNLPCDSAILSTITPSQENDNFSHCLLANAELLNGEYTSRVQVFKHFTKWFNPKYKGEQIRTLLLLPWNNLTGIKTHHMPISYTKKTFSEVWDRHPDELLDAAKDKFRNNFKINHWVFRYEQLLSGQFAPRDPKTGRLYMLKDEPILNELMTDLKKHQHPLICINDSGTISKEQFNNIKKYLQKVFDEELPEKSSFEK